MTDEIAAGAVHPRNDRLIVPPHPSPVLVSDTFELY